MSGVCILIPFLKVLSDIFLLFLYFAIIAQKTESAPSVCLLKMGVNSLFILQMRITIVGLSLWIVAGPWSLPLAGQRALQAGLAASTCAALTVFPLFERTGLLLIRSGMLGVQAVFFWNLFWSWLPARQNTGAFLLKIGYLVGLSHHTRG